MGERDRFPEEGEIEKIAIDGQGGDWNLKIKWGERRKERFWTGNTERDN